MGYYLPGFLVLLMVSGLGFSIRLLVLCFGVGFQHLVRSCRGKAARNPSLFSGLRILGSQKFPMS